MVAKVGGTEGGMGGEFEISKCKLFYIYMYNCITLLCTKNYHNTTNQLYFNKINLKIIIPNLEILWRLT